MFVPMGCGMYTFAFLHFEGDEEEYNNRILAFIYCIGKVIDYIVLCSLHARSHLFCYLGYIS